jgi:phage head maturation protease
VSNPNIRLAPDVAPQLVGSNSSRTVRYVFSDPSVGRDGHTIAANAWVLDNYRRNPVFLFPHDATQAPIGRVVEIGTVGNRLMGTVEYADAETYPFADTIYRLVKGGYLNAVSVSWNPITWKYSTDKNRPSGSIDFLRTELLEVANVPLPSAPLALAVARSSGVDTGPLSRWAERALSHGEELAIDRTTLAAIARAAAMPRSIVLGDRNSIAGRRALARSYTEQYRARQTGVEHRTEQARQIRRRLRELGYLAQ